MKIDIANEKGRGKKITQNNGRCRVIREHRQRDGNGKLVTDEVDKAKGLKEFLAPVISEAAEGNIPGPEICFPQGKKENVKRFYSCTGVDNKAISTIKSCQRTQTGVINHILGL